MSAWTERRVHRAAWSVLAQYACSSDRVGIILAAAV